MRRTTLTALAASCALLAGLAACGGDPEPKFTKSATPTHPVSSSPTPTQPTPPEMPAAATKHTKRGAIAFTRFFFKTADYAQATLDLQPLIDLADPDCDACQAGISGLRKIAARHGVVKGGQTSISHVRASASSAFGENWMMVRFHRRTAAGTVDYPGTKKDHGSPLASGDAYVVLKPTPSGWLVDYWEVQ